jgi:hypothetical protein
LRKDYFPNSDIWCLRRDWEFNKNGPARRSSKSEGGSRRYKKTVSNRDISEYQVNEPAPTDAYFNNVIVHLLSLAASKPDTFAAMRRYVGQWSRWLKLGLSTIKEFETYVLTFLPGITSCWMPGSNVFTLGNCH